MIEGWRQKFQRLGMRQVSAWVPKNAADALQQFFTRVGSQSEDGQFLRMMLNRQANRRRVIEKIFDGRWMKVEIDLPRLSVGSEQAPIGGRIYGDGSTLIELDPFEAAELERKCSEAIEPVLCEWLERHDLKNVIRNTTGVALDGNALAYNRAPQEIFERTPKADEEFEKNESAIVADFERRAFYHGALPPDDPTLQHFIGSWGIPSRYRLVHGAFLGRLCVGLIHVEGGGASVTNAIEEIARDIYQKFYRAKRPDEIEWYDVWPAHYSLIDTLRINRVRFKDGRFAGPDWRVGDDVPPPFVRAIEAVIEQGGRAETEAFYRSNPEKNWVFPLNRKTRLSYGDFQADIVIDGAPKVEAIAVLGSWPHGTEDYGKPYLFVSSPGAYEFRHKEICAALLQHWGDDANILGRESSLISSWDDPDLFRFCQRANLPLQAAKSHYTQQSERNKKGG